MTKLTSKTILTIVQLTINHNADSDTATHMEIDHIALILRLSRSILGIATGTSIIL
jgi:hypothetical protein